MGKLNANRKVVFSIIIVISINTVWQVFTRGNTSINHKIIFTLNNLIYLYLVSEFIEINIYHSILKNVLSCKNYSPIWIYKLFYIFLPIISLIAYISAWLIFTDNSQPLSIITVIIIMSSSFLFFTVRMKNYIMFGNKDYIFLYKKMLPVSSIKTLELKEKKSGNNIIIINLTLYSGESYTLSIDNEQLNEVLNIISK